MITEAQAWEWSAGATAETSAPLGAIPDERIRVLAMRRAVRMSTDVAMLVLDRTEPALVPALSNALHDLAYRTLQRDNRFRLSRSERPLWEASFRNKADDGSFRRTFGGRALACRNRPFVSLMFDPVMGEYLCTVRVC